MHLLVVILQQELSALCLPSVVSTRPLQGFGQVGFTSVHHSLVQRLIPHRVFSHNIEQLGVYRPFAVGVRRV